VWGIHLPLEYIPVSNKTIKIDIQFPAINSNRSIVVKNTEEHSNFFYCARSGDCWWNGNWPRHSSVVPNAGIDLKLDGKCWSWAETIQPIPDSATFKAAWKQLKVMDLYTNSGFFFADLHLNALFSSVSTLLRNSNRCVQNLGLSRHFINLILHHSELATHGNTLSCHFMGLALNEPHSSTEKPNLETARESQKEIKPPRSPIRPIPSRSRYRHGRKFSDSYGMLCIFLSMFVSIALVGCGGLRFDRGRRVAGALLIVGGFVLDALACVSGAVGCLPWDWWRCLHDGEEHSDNNGFHRSINVSQKLLTMLDYCNTLIVVRRTQMANVLSTDKQIAVISALAEGSSIRSIERITGVHRDTIMRLGVRVGQGCAALLDEKMRNLPCQQLQFDEIWGFIGKKERHCNIDDNPELGDVWTFCAIDRDTKIVPSFRCGKRDLATANAFVADVASRMRNRVQISSDALRAYVDAIEINFGADVDFTQIVKTYVTDDSHIPERRFSAPEIVITEKKAISGFPDMGLASTSHVERLNGTTRLHMRRLTRLTYAFSKKLDNFKAAVALHFAYYNFVKRHNTLRATPAMAAGIERDFWTVNDLIAAV